MNRKGYNWRIGVLAVILTLAVLMGGQAAWNKYFVAQPLDKVFTGIDGVQKSSWEEGKKDDAVQIYITLANAANFAKTYGAIAEGAKGVLGAKPFRIRLTDSRTPELEQFYYKAHYHLQEAIQTGRFSDMADRVQALAREAGVTARIYVESKAVYVQLEKDGAQMYVVVTR